MKTFAIVCAFIFSLLSANVASAAGSPNPWEQGLNDVFNALSKLEVSPRSLESVRVKSVVARLAQASGEQWNVLVFSDVEIPAVSLPGNRVAIQAEFVRLLDDDGLAWVLAHEMSHVQAKHNETNYQLLVETLGHAPRSLDEIQAGKQKMVPHLHAHEFEADANGVVLATSAGFDAVSGSVAVLSLMSEGQSATHPSTAARIKAILALQK